jgi:hypothetical protein
MTKFGRCPNDERRDVIAFRRVMVDVVAETGHRSGFRARTVQIDSHFAADWTGTLSRSVTHKSAFYIKSRVAIIMILKQRPRSIWPVTRILAMEYCFL